MISYADIDGLSLKDLVILKLKIDEEIKKKIREQKTNVSTVGLTLKLSIDDGDGIKNLCNREILEFEDCVMEKFEICDVPVQLNTTFENRFQLCLHEKEIKDLLGY